MSYNDAPPPYPGPPSTEDFRPFPNTENGIPVDKKDPKGLQAEHDSRNRYDPSNNLQPGPSTPRPSSAPGHDYNSQPPRGLVASIPAQAGNVPPAVVFHVYTTKRMWGRELAVTINGKTDVAFHVTLSSRGLFSSRPDMTVQRGSSSGPVLGTAYFRTGWSSSQIELEFPQAGTSTEMNRTGLWSRACTVRLDGQMLEWRGTHHNGASRWSDASLKLVDGGGRIYAVYADTTYKAMTKQGRLSIEVPGLSDNMIEQIVCSGIALAEKERRTRAGAAASSSSAAAAGC